MEMPFLPSERLKTAGVRAKGKGRVVLSFAIPRLMEETSMPLKGWHILPWPLAIGLANRTRLIFPLLSASGFP